MTAKEYTIKNTNPENTGITTFDTFGFWCAVSVMLIIKIVVTIILNSRMANPIQVYPDDSATIAQSQYEASKAAIQLEQIKSGKLGK